MKVIARTAAIALLAFAGAAYAKDEVKDPQVKLRVETMDSIVAQVKTLGDMAAGKVAFDAAAAAAAKATLVEKAGAIHTVFEPQATDPASKAKPDIWSNWGDFIEKAAALKSAATSLDPSSLDGLRAGMGAVGGACKGCHQTYRN